VIFSGTRLAADQDRNVVIEYLLDRLQKVPDGRSARAKEIAEKRITTFS
jgi:hypothetical protein